MHQFIKNLYRKILSLKYIILLDKKTKEYINFNKKIFSKNQKIKQYKGIVLIDFFDWKPFIFFWSILSNYLKSKKNYK